MSTDHAQKPREYEQTAEESDSRRICVVGLGYVGLPIAVEFDQAGHSVAGFDIDPEKIEQLTTGHDPTGDVGADGISSCDVEFTTDAAVMGNNINGETRCVLSRYGTVKSNQRTTTT